jgi:hypothetical protein
VRYRGQDVWLTEQRLLEEYHTEDGSALRLLLEPMLPIPHPVGVWGWAYCRTSGRALAWSLTTG